VAFGHSIVPLTVSYSPWNKWLDKALYQPIPNAPWFSSETLALYKSLTYLLTYIIHNGINFV